MIPPPGDGAGVLPRLLAIAAAVVAMIALILLLRPLVEPGAEPQAPPAPRAAFATPIAAEADVFRTKPGSVAIANDAPRRNEAHPRTLQMYRSLRAYPGAPPRIPHGLTRDEFRNTGCATCHTRGGWAARFSSYAPVNPHPEYTNCLQCHAPDDRVIGIALPDASPNSVCLQCHAPGKPAASFATLDWRPAAWPTVDQRALPGSPPLIPHDLHLRGNCLACHLGPAGVEEIRTTHPERANCRQCHAPTRNDAQTDGDEVFTRPLDGAIAAGRGS